MHTEPAFPHHWAVAQSNLGNLYVAQPEHSRDEGLLAAIGFLVYQDDRYQALHLIIPERVLSVRIANWPEQR